MTRDTLPLWSTFRRYFEGCPAGSAIPLVHTQDVSEQGRAALKRLIEPFGGHLIPIEATVRGNPRFSWRMVQMMLRLYGLAASSVAPNGCVPSYVHTLSERDVPVRSCKDVHAFLETTAGASHIEWMDDPIRLNPYKGQRPRSQQAIPEAFRVFGRTSQWMTLWVPHAAALAAEEDTLRRKWEPHQGRWDVWVDGEDGRRYAIWGALDEMMWPTELQQRSLPISRLPTYEHGFYGGLTYRAPCRSTSLYCLSCRALS